LLFELSETLAFVNESVGLLETSSATFLFCNAQAKVQVKEPFNLHIKP
jgi:hypothetical protein